MSDTTAGVNDTEEDRIPWSEMDDQTQYVAIELAINSLCDTLHLDGADPELITAVLFNAFTQRMADTNDREQYETILESALGDEWEVQSVH